MHLKYTKAAHIVYMSGGALRFSRHRGAVPHDSMRMRIGDLFYVNRAIISTARGTGPTSFTSQTIYYCLIWTALLLHSE